MTNPRGKVTTYTYDLGNRLTAETDPLSRTTSYTYDAAGRRTSRLDAKNQTTGYGYDVLDRATSITYPAGTPSVSFTYDALGNRLAMADGTGTTTFSYDALYRPTSIKDGQGSVVGYAYDTAGRRTSVTYPGATGTATYAYDASGRMTSVTDWLTHTTSYTYDDANRLTSTTLGNGLIADRTYDSANRLLTLVNRNGGTTISSYAYTVDNIGNRSQMVDTSGTTAYGYDGVYRLTGTMYPNADAQSYTYDPQGNRLAKVNNGNTTNYSYDNADQMTLAGGVSYSYDNDGNQTAAGSDAFGWDAENRMVSTNIGGVASSYIYNGASLRTSRTIGGATVTYAWDLNGSLPNILKDSTGNAYVYGLDLISKTSGANTEYYLGDGLGSTTGVADGSGTVTGSYTYDVFGALRTQWGTTTEWSYTGEQNDPTGLEYLRTRYYDPATGRFASEDLLPLAQRYAYVGGNPVTLTDGNGMCGWVCPLPMNPSIDNVAQWTGERLHEVKRGTVDPFVQGAQETGDLLANSYYDLNVTLGCGGNVITAGLQVDRTGGYGYGGGGRGTCGVDVSVSIAPYQSVTEGLNCGLSGTYKVAAGDLLVGGTAQRGYGAIHFKEGQLRGTKFKEYGVVIGSSGVAATCSYVHKYWSWR